MELFGGDLPGQLPIEGAREPVSLAQSRRPTARPTICEARSTRYTVGVPVTR